MGSRIGLTLVVALLLGADPTKKPQGVWVYTEYTVGGEKIDPKQSQLEFKGDKFTYTAKGEDTVTGTYTIDREKSPATMDLTIEREGEKITLSAIYELTGDVLKLCYPTRNSVSGGRPKKFEATAHTVLAIFKRQKS
ncbi:MAG: TIGR03067 domain-containing protein [Planctomycetes bacterium]|nr:TIGR03067 domain-containing protein [Planctomycetota bacterium]